MNKTFKFHLEQILVFVLMLGVFSYGMRTGLGHAAMLTWLFALAAFSYGHSINRYVCAASSAMPRSFSPNPSSLRVYCACYLTLIGSSSLMRSKKATL
jgi:hypothetical protein